VSEKYADILQGEEDWKGAADVLSRIPLTSSQVSLCPYVKRELN
jgi:hypothetical protein